MLADDSNRSPWAIVNQAMGNPQEVPQPDDREKQLLQDFEQAYHDAKSLHDFRRNLIDYCTWTLKGETLLARTVNHEYLRVVVEGNPQRPRSVDNKMRVANRAFVAKLIKIIPKVRVRPRSSDRDDAIAASVMDSFLDALWEGGKFQLKYKRACSWIPRAGMGVLEAFWNKQGGRRLAACPQCKTAWDVHEQEVGAPCPACAADAQAKMADQQAQMLQMQRQSMMAGAPGPEMPPMEPPSVPNLEEVREGEIELVVHDPREFMPDPGAGHPEEMQYAVVSKVLPISVGRRMFPDKWQLIQPESGLYADKFLATTYGSPLSHGRIEKKQLKNHFRLDRLVLMPTPEHPNGQTIYRGCGRILEESDCKTAELCGRLPFFLLRGDVDDGEMWPEPIILLAECLQRERDVLMTQKRQHRDLVMNPPIFVSAGSGIDNKFMDRTPGKIVTIRPTAMEPRPMRVGQFPAYIENEDARLEAAIFEKWGVTPYERGQQPSDTSGRLAAFLDTIAQAVVAAMLVEIYAEWRDLHRALIMMGQHYYAADRVWTIYGQDRAKLITHSWAEANVKPGWDVYVVEDDALAKNPVMRLQQTTELSAQRPELFADQQTGRFDIKRFRQMSGLQLESLSPDTDTSEHERAAKVPEAIKLWMQQKGPYPTPQPFDDPWITIEEIKGWLQTQGRNEDPRVVQEVVRLWQTYISAVMPEDPQAAGAVDPMYLKLLPITRLAGAQMPQGNKQPTSGGGGAPQGGQQAPGGEQSANTQEANAKIQAVDKSNEQLAHGNQPHEG